MALSVAVAGVVGTLIIDSPAMACSVCFGDPNSALVKGAQAGILVLLGAIACVLMALVSLMIFWARRAAKLEAAPSNTAALTPQP